MHQWRITIISFFNALYVTLSFHSAVDTLNAVVSVKHQPQVYRDMTLINSHGQAPYETDIPAEFEDHLKNSFGGDIANVREEMVKNALSMFGPGFTWLVQDKTPSQNRASTLQGDSTITSQRERLHFRILNTYIAGTPYPGAHNRRQPVDMNSRPAALTGQEWERQSLVQNRPGSFGRAGSAAYQMGLIGNEPGGDEPSVFGGANIVPLLCVNTWPHVYLMDWGVAGKSQFLRAWWDRINWPHVWSLVIKNTATRGGRSYVM